MTATREEIGRGLRSLGLGGVSHVLVHSSYKVFGGVDGGPSAVLRALVDTVATVMMPASTWERTAVWDASGLFEGNAYRPEPPPDGTAEPFGYGTPIDREIGVIPETFRREFAVCRSGHPLQSFIAYGALAKKLAGPGDDTHDIAPVKRLVEADGEVLLLGVTHTRSTAVHLAEYLAGRRPFIRHALTQQGVRAVLCGGDSEGFDELQPHVDEFERGTTVGNATLRCYRLQPYVDAARQLIENDPQALLDDCERCRATRKSVLVR